MDNKKIILIISGIAVACVLISALGIGGYFVWSAFNKRNTELTAAQNRSQELQNNITAGQGQAANLQKNLDALQTNYDSLDADFKILTDNFNTLTDDHNALKAEAEKTKQDLAAAKTKNEGMQSDLEKTRTELDSLLARLKTAYAYANMVYIIYAPWRGATDFDFNDAEISQLRVDVQPWLDQVGDSNLQGLFDEMLNAKFENAQESAFHLALLEALENSLR
jgi:peptidoglycan hydrolase CwlO-like protein